MKRIYKKELIQKLQELKEATLASDFGDAFADTPEEALELAGRDVLDVAIFLFEQSLPTEKAMTKIEIGDFVKIKVGAYKELVKCGWASNVPEDIDGKSAKVVSDYRDAPEPHLAVNLEYSTEEIGIPESYLEEIL